MNAQTILSNRRSSLALVFVVALLLRLVTLAVLLPKFNLDVDMDHYRSLGRSLAAGKGFVATSSDGRELPNVGRTPLYPLFLAGLMKLGGDQLGVFLLVQCLLWSVICVLTVLLAACWLPWRAATWVGLIVAVDPNCVTRAVDLRTETLFTLLLVGGVCLLAWRGQNASGWFWSGLVWSLAALCRPIAVWFWVAALILAIMCRVGWRHFAAFLIGFLLLISPWTARNAALTGRWFFSTNPIDNLLVSWAAGVEATQRGISVEAAQQELLAKVGLVEFFDDRASFAKRVQDSVDTSRRILMAAPQIVLKEAVLGWAKLLLGPGSRTLEPSLRKPEPPARWWPPLYRLSLGGGLILGLVGLWKLKRAALLPGIVLLYFVLLAGGPVSYSRYRVPVTPLLALLTVVGCTTRKEA